MKAVLNGTVLAEADKDDLVFIDGAWYFPPEAVHAQEIEKSDTQYTCSWRGEAQYYQTNDGAQRDVGWAYPSMSQDAKDRVGKDVSQYVAFDPSVGLVD
ncbi:DUF427 domain-containing protein [Demequina sp. NBRC 110053]|uniref:DUF427 domain-containing protein n=1 Tax=Demequina sp. NBRC 110053 TaxID=1570342 RepID=UPI000A0597D6|nr:DUF427 domain-containing protein [Demequina sp. NBRC 110053]